MTSSQLSKARSGGTSFAVNVFKFEGGWRVEISDPIGRQAGQTGRSGVGAFAAVEAYDLDTAMRMAVPYLACVSEPDPFASILRMAPNVPEAESSPVNTDSPFGI